MKGKEGNILLENISKEKKTHTILVIDDEFKILLGLRVLLERSGYQVIICSDSQSGLQAAEESHPDLIICDVMLPLMDGFKIKEKLSACPLTKNIPFLFLSARVSKADKLSGFAAGADDYITKPFDPQELAARIKAIFHRQDLSDQKAAQEMDIQIDRIKTEISNHVSRKLQTKLHQSMAQMLARRDNETEEHAHRVVKLSESLARSLGMEGQTLEHIRLGALLHDIGMVGIPDDIILKEGSLSVEERKIMMSHVVVGKNILQPLDMPPAVLELVYYHHEHWDGSGYPDGLAGERIPLPARIFAIVDTWDALTTNRSYQEVWASDKVITYITEQAGKRFDPGIINNFLHIIQSENQGR